MNRLQRPTFKEWAAAEHVNGTSEVRERYRRIETFIDDLVRPEVERRMHELVVYGQSPPPHEMLVDSEEDASERQAVKQANKDA